MWDFNKWDTKLTLSHLRVLGLWHHLEDSSWKFLTQWAKKWETALNAREKNNPHKKKNIIFGFVEVIEENNK